MRGKNPIPQDGNGGSGEMTVMIFQLKGNNATLQQGFRTIGAALDNMIAKAARPVGPPPTPNLLPPIESEEPPPAPEVQNGETQENGSEIETPARSATPRPRKPPTPKIIPLELGKGTPPFKEFMEKHDPGQPYKRVLLLAYWLKKNLGVEDVSMHHVHTCFRHMGWPTPDDPALPLRDMKQPKYGWFDKAEARGHYKINHIGDNTAEEILNSKKK